MGQRSEGETGARARQPYLFDLVCCVNAPSLVLSSPDGQIGEGGVQGWLCADRRFLSRLRVTANGFEPVGLRSDSARADVISFGSVVPDLGDGIDDPTVFVRRQRELAHQQMVETLTVTSSAQQPVDVELGVMMGADFSGMAEVRTGHPRRRTTPEASADGLRWASEGDALTLVAEPPPDNVDVGRGAMSWTTTLGRGESLSVQLRFTAEPGRDSKFRGVHAPPWGIPEVTSPDGRLDRLLRQGLGDLEGLLLADPAETGDEVFAAAGIPWFLTLFGRDSLWTARMLLPLGTGLAMSTLRVLARRQGTRHDPDTEEQPGRILHEVRAEPLVLGHTTLPPTYYGTVDATPLFVTCCAEAWRWGADPAEVEAVLPAVVGCLRWLEEQVGEDGFVRYVDATGHGLSNQGWKDSEDSIQWADGSLAEPPIALSEVQAYAYQAAMLGADLLDGFERPGGDRWRAWAGALADRFRDRFWVEDGFGRYPAIALDAQGEAVDSVASNMAHLLGTGLLSPDERALVAARIGSPELDSGFGLRTLTARSPRFSALSYHGGAVWPHDTAIAVMGLARDGFRAEARSLFEGMVRAAPHFGFRLPELYAGDDGREVDTPAPYPAACRPQAWAAAAPLAALVALLGLEVDAPNGTVTAVPTLPRSMLPLRLSGLMLGNRRVAVSVDVDGTGAVEAEPE